MKFKILALLIPLLLTLGACGSNVEATTMTDDKTSAASVEALTKEEVENMIENAVAKSASEIAGNIDSSISEGIASQLDVDSIKGEIKQQILSELSEVIKQEVSDYGKANKEKPLDTDALTKNILDSVNGMVDEKIAGLQLVQNVTYNTTEEVVRVEEKIVSAPEKIINDGDIVTLSHELPAEYIQENGSKVVLENFEVRAYNNRTAERPNAFKYKMVATFNGYIENINEDGEVRVWIGTGLGDTGAAMAVVRDDSTFSGERIWEWETVPNSFSVGNVTISVYNNPIP